MTHLHYGSIRSPLIGELFAAASPRGLCRVSYGQTEAAFAAELRGLTHGPVERCDRALATVLAQLEEYLEGRRQAFECELDLGVRTPFQERVLHTVGRIPWGEVLTYGEVAEEAGRPGAARAVGQVMRA